METNHIDPDRGYTGQDLKTGGLGISIAGLIFCAVGYVFAGKHDPQDIHAAWFFGVTGFFIFAMGAGTFIAGLKKGGRQGGTSSPNTNPSASDTPLESTKTNP